MIVKFRWMRILGQCILRIPARGWTVTTLLQQTKWTRKLRTTKAIKAIQLIKHTPLDE
jgi:hypothetical protein